MDVPRSWLRRCARKRVWYTLWDVAPGRIKRVLCFAERAGPSLDDRSTIEPKKKKVGTCDLSPGKGRMLTHPNETVVALMNRKALLGGSWAGQRRAFAWRAAGAIPTAPGT